MQAICLFNKNLIITHYITLYLVFIQIVKMEAIIKGLIESHGNDYVPIEQESSIKVVYDLFLLNQKIADEDLNSTECLYYGYYYMNIEKNYDLVKKYYLMAIEKGNHGAMCDLGSFYGNIEKNYDLVKKYYLMAIEKGNHGAMCNLGWHYDDIEGYGLVH